MAWQNSYSRHSGLLQDMAPYVPLVMPELQAALIDPLPEVRATAARALGSLLQGMGDELAKQVMPWLLQTLKSDVRPLLEHQCMSCICEVMVLCMLVEARLTFQSDGSLHAQRLHCSWQHRCIPPNAVNAC